MRRELHARLTLLKDGISEFTFANLYLFRNTYDYHVSQLTDGTLIVSGRYAGERFLMFPEGLPKDDTSLRMLFDEYEYVKCISEKIADSHRVDLERQGFELHEDRDNFDYLYLRTELVSLSGRKYHKKRNLVNAFLNNYSYEEEPLTPNNMVSAYKVLEQWHALRPDRDDYDAAIESLDRIGDLELCGYLITANDDPVAFIMGESLDRGRIFVVHFEKALSNYKGVYQFINRAFAAILPRHYTYINREQDLGDSGLRQAKMTYRPCGFVKKYKLVTSKK